MKRRSFLALLGLSPIATATVAKPLLQNGTTVTDFIEPNYGPLVVTGSLTASQINTEGLRAKVILGQSLPTEKIEGLPVLVSYVDGRPVQKMQWLR